MPDINISGVEINVRFVPFWRENRGSQGPMGRTKVVRGGCAGRCCFFKALAMRKYWFSLYASKPLPHFFFSFYSKGLCGFSSFIMNMRSAGITSTVKMVETARPPRTTLPSPL